MQSLFRSTRASKTIYLYSSNIIYVNVHTHETCTCTFKIILKGCCYFCKSIAYQVLFSKDWVAIFILQFIIDIGMKISANRMTYSRWVLVLNNQTYSYKSLSIYGINNRTPKRLWNRLLYDQLLYSSKT